jgi:hypothetical protein
MQSSEKSLARIALVHPSMEPFSVTPWPATLALLLPHLHVHVMPDNKHTGTTIKVTTIKVRDGIRSERAFDLQKGDEGRRVSHLTSRRETTGRTTISVLTY